jgi:hypothetical protein
LGAPQATAPASSRGTSNKLWSFNRSALHLTSTNHALAVAPIQFTRSSANDNTPRTTVILEVLECLSIVIVVCAALIEYAVVVVVGATKNMISLDDLDDEFEDEVREECTTYGPVSKVSIQSNAGNVIVHVTFQEPEGMIIDINALL